jgi:DNA (cytosine-5)-methyltransferase 1
LCSNHPKVYTYKDKGVIDPHSSYVTVAGGGNCPLEVGSKAMGIDWMTQRELSQAVPPAYTRYVGKFAKAYLQPR